MKTWSRVLLLSLTLWSCGGNGGSDLPQDVVQQEVGDVENDSETTLPPDHLEFELFDTTHVLESEQLAQLAGLDSDGTLRFSLDSSFAAGLSVGEVVIIPITEHTPYGHLSEVISVETQDGEIRVGTKACPIQKAFRRLNVEFHRPIQASAEEMQWSDIVTQGLTVRRGEIETTWQASEVGDMLGPYVLEFWPFDGDGDHDTPEDQVHVRAELSGGMYFFYGMSFDWPEVWEADFLPDIKVGFEVYGGAKLNALAEGVAARNFDEDYELGGTDLEPFCIWILCFLPHLDLKANVSGGASSRYTLEMDAEASFTAGATYKTGEGGKVTPPTPVLEGSAPQVTVMEQAKVRVSIGPRITLALYGIFGPYAEVDAYAELNAESNRDPCFQILGGLEGDIGFQLELWGYSLAEWGQEFDLLSLEC